MYRPAPSSRFRASGRLRRGFCGLGASVSIPDLLNAAAAKYGLSPDLLSAVAKQESNYNPNAVSSAGAQGVMQLMPRTAAGLGVSDPFDAAQNIDGGARYLSQLLAQFNGDTSLALAAYNAGPGNVTKYGGIPPFAETQSYVSSILARIGITPASGDTSAGDWGPQADFAAPSEGADPWLLAGLALAGVALVWAVS